MLQKYTLTLATALLVAAPALAETYKTGQIESTFNSQHKFSMTIKVENGQLKSVKGHGARIKNPRVTSISSSHVNFVADVNSKYCPKTTITVNWPFNGTGSYDVAKPCQFGKQSGKFKSKQ